MNATKTDEVNEILKSGFIQLGILYAKLYESDKERFVYLFRNAKSFRSVCSCIYWAYLKNSLIEEVKPESGESKERYIGRKILKVIEAITENV